MMEVAKRRGLTIARKIHLLLLCGEKQEYFGLYMKCNRGTYQTYSAYY
jgi:hypothetical protein